MANKNPNDLRADEVRGDARTDRDGERPSDRNQVVNTEQRAKALDERHPRPEGVAVPPVLPNSGRELNEAEKTLARQQAAAGQTGERTPAEHALDKAKEISMTDQPNQAELHAAKNSPNSSARNP